MVPTWSLNPHHSSSELPAKKTAVHRPRGDFAASRLKSKKFGAPEFGKNKNAADKEIQPPNPIQGGIEPCLDHEKKKPSESSATK